MFPASFEYYRASSIQDAISKLAQSENAKILSGGHSLLPMMKLRLAQPALLVDISGIKQLSYINQENGRIRIGANTLHRQVENDDLVRNNLPVLSQCAAQIGDVQVRNRGTIGGSLSHADPAADYPASVLALEGEIKANGPDGSRVIKASDFFVDLMTTAIRPNELLTDISFAPLPQKCGSSYLKFRQPASGFAIVGVAAVVRKAADNVCESIRIGITGLAARAFRAATVESALAGKTLDPNTIAAAAAHACDGVEALSDIHASADFRAEIARVYTRRAIAQAAAACRS